MWSISENGDGERDDDGAHPSDLWSWRGGYLGNEGVRECDGWGGGVLMYDGYEGTL